MDVSASMPCHVGLWARAEDVGRAELYHARGRYAEAEPLYARAHCPFLAEGVSDGLISRPLSAG